MPELFDLASAQEINEPPCGGSVRWVGVEPTRLAAHGPQPCLSANSSTSANAKVL